MARSRFRIEPTPSHPMLRKRASVGTMDERRRRGIVMGGDAPTRIIPEPMHANDGLSARVENLIASESQQGKLWTAWQAEVSLRERAVRVRQMVNIILSKGSSLSSTQATEFAVRLEREAYFSHPTREDYVRWCRDESSMIGDQRLERSPQQADYQEQLRALERQMAQRLAQARQEQLKALERQNAQRLAQAMQEQSRALERQNAQQLAQAKQEIYESNPPPVPDSQPTSIVRPTEASRPTKRISVITKPKVKHTISEDLSGDAGKRKKYAILIKQFGLTSGLVPGASHLAKALGSTGRTGGTLPIATKVKFGRTISGSLSGEARKRARIG